MSEKLVRIGNDYLMLSAVAGAHWDGVWLFVYLVGGHCMSFRDDEAMRVWEVLCRNSDALGLVEMRQ